MKKLLFIFLFFSFKSYSQVVITEVTRGYSTTGVGGTTLFAFAPGDVFIIFLGVSNAGGTPATVTVGGTFSTWTPIDTWAPLNHRIEAYRWAPSTSGSESLFFSYVGAQDGSFVVLYKVTGVDATGTNGSNAIVQSVTASATGSNPTVTMAGISSPNNAVLAGFINNISPFGGAPESGWTEEDEDGYNTPSTGGYIMYRIATTDNTPTITTGSSSWAGIAIELKSLLTRRRIFIQ